jgi:hypothetical protein
VYISARFITEVVDLTVNTGSKETGTRTQMLVVSLNTKFNENQFSCSVVAMCGRTDRHTVMLKAVGSFLAKFSLEKSQKAMNMERETENSAVAVTSFVFEPFRH